MANRSFSFVFGLLALCAIFTLQSNVHAQDIGFGRIVAVGGVSIDANGVVKNSTKAEVKELEQLRKDALKGTSENFAAKTKLRKISLKKLGQLISEHAAAKKPLPAEVHVLGGLQRIEYVFAYPEQNDIVIAGPAEGWKVNDDGSIVGETTGNPVVMLDDLIVALRTADEATRNTITCSIDPTAEGIRNLNNVVAQQGGRLSGNPSVIAKSFQEALGPQDITLRTIPNNSRTAAVMLAADYRMKRIAMGFEPSPVREIKSFLKSASGGNMFPRWWMAMDYDALSRNKENTAWQIKGQGVKTLTEDSYFEANGQRKTTKNVNPAAKRWADSMTDNYDALAAAIPVFGELRNVMDLAVMGAIMKQHDMAKNTGLDLSPYLGDDYKAAAMNVPKQIPTVVNFVKKGRNTVFTASGGVEINPYTVINNNEVDDNIEATYLAANTNSDSNWWWD